MTKYGDYRPAFVTQRDGSSLANSNCRMASISMGLAYDASPQGSKTSTGKEMRTYTDDQSGGNQFGRRETGLGPRLRRGAAGHGREYV